MSKYYEDLDYLIKDENISKEELEEIIAVADKIISDVNSERNKLIEAYLKKVQCLQELDKHTESKEFIDKLLTFNPNMPEAIVRLGIVYSENKEYNKAIDCKSKAIEIKPDYAYAYYSRGYTKDDLSDYHGAIEDYTKAIKFKPNYVEAYYNRGIAKCELSDNHGAIEDYTKAIEIKPDNADAYFARGYTKYNLSGYCGAIEDYTKAIEIKPDNADAYLNCGIAKFDLSDYHGAIEDYTKAIKIRPDYAEAYFNCGIAKFDLSDYHGAIEDYTKAIEIRPDYAEAYYNRGYTKDELSNYRDAMEDYTKAIEFKPDDVDAYFCRGYTKSNLSDYCGAIEDYTKAIEIKPDYTMAYNNCGIARFNLSDYRGAIEDYNKLIEIKPDCANVYENRGFAKYKLSDYDGAVEDFLKAETDILNLLIICGETDGVKVAKSMLDNDDYDTFFKEVTKNCKKEEREHYKDTYIQSLKIISKLQVKDEKEMSVSHYTKKETAEKLLYFDDYKNENGKEKPQECFRLSSVNTSNDPEEGKTLFHYLFPQNEISKQEDEFGAFAGCFILNKDSLNQFRLYGKKRNKEGTGISIVLKKQFFNEEMSRPLKPESTKKRENLQKYLPLFRCIYIDPESKPTPIVVSLGQKEDYVFYREGKQKKEYKDYKNNIDKTQKKIIAELEKLKKQITKLRLDPDVVYKLLLNLRYLVKHTAFKEEQECRVIQIKKFDDKDVKSDKDNRYVEYLKLDKRNVSEICFGPKAKGIDKFKQHLANNNYSIKCDKSKAPLA